MTFDQPRKNYSGFAFIAALHALVFAIAIQHSTVWIKHDTESPPIEVKPLPPKTEEPVPPDSAPEKFRFTDTRPVTEVPVPPVNFDDVPTLPPAPPGPRPMNVEPGGTVDAPPTPPRHEAVRIAPVIDVRACTKPAYPQSALRNGDSGTVVLSFLIGTDGRVADAKVEKTSGFRDLDRAAMSGLGQCRFKPGTVDGVPYESWTRVQYVWSLDE